MSRPRIYTQRANVTMRAAHRDELEAHLPDIGVVAWLRDSALRVIGREDLIIDSQRDESGHRKLRKPDDPDAWVWLPVALTTEQMTAITEAAKSRCVSRSSLIHDAARFELGLPPVTETAKGWKRGKRRSKPPRS